MSHRSAPTISRNTAVSEVRGCLALVSGPCPQQRRHVFSGDERASALLANRYADLGEVLDRLHLHQRVVQ